MTSSLNQSPNGSDGVDQGETSDVQYDVIICGTDLVQSILSSALSRAGKKVLHCDGNGWYGGLDAVLYGGSTLESFIEVFGRDSNRLEEYGKIQHDEISSGGLGMDSIKSIGSLDGLEKKKINRIGSLDLLREDKYADIKVHSQSFLPSGNKYDSQIDENPRCDASDSPSTSDCEGTIPENEFVADDKPGVARDEGVEDECDIGKSTTEPDTNHGFSSKAENCPLEHGFLFDLTPSLLYASGDTVDLLVKSGVADYLEFKSLEGLLLLMGDNNEAAEKKARRRKVANQIDRSNLPPDANKGQAVDGPVTESMPTLYRVPCSKSDVFQSKLLSPIDKRRLMKFLQLISDYGMATQAKNGTSDQDGDSKSNDGEDSPGGASTENQPEKENNSSHTEEEVLENSRVDASGKEAVHSVNERHLHRGRALSRPQNKAIPSSSDMDSLLKCVKDNVSFVDFLANVAKLPPRLCTVVLYALALAPCGHSSEMYSTEEGLEDLLQHLNALGRFGDTAFLVPMYGSGELSQAFCRSGAVYGSTYMLRRSPLAISLTINESIANCVRGVILGGEKRLGGDDDKQTDDVLDKEILCEHVIFPSTMVGKAHSKNSSRLRTYRRVSILEGKLVKSKDQSDEKNSSMEQRHAVVIPPGTNSLGNESVIHGIVVDDSVSVAPQGSQFTVLHLSISIEENHDTESNEKDYVDLLRKAVALIIGSQSTEKSIDGSGKQLKECHHFSFSYSSTVSNAANAFESKNITGLHTCHRGKPSITCDLAFREAYRIFKEICPNSDFLTLSQEVEDSIVYRNVEESDDEKIVLESACTMIQASIPDNSADNPE